jgi:hypothetical protein
MSSDAGGYGTMVFPDAAAVAKWKRAKVSPEAYDDWIGDFEGGGIEPDETVAKRLARIAKGHAPQRRTVQQVDIDGLCVTLAWQTDTAAFNALVTDFAAFFRSADAFGAKGAFYFLGFNGDEGDFGYAVTLDGKRSKVSELRRKQRMKLVRSEEFRAFEGRVSAALDSVAPKPAVGAKLKPVGNTLHDRVVAALAGFTDEQLFRGGILEYSGVLPGAQFAVKVFPLDAVRAKFSNPADEETRAAALLTLGKLDANVAIPIALDAVRTKSLHDAVRYEAFAILKGATGDTADVVLGIAERYLLESKSSVVRLGALGILKSSTRPGAIAAFERVLDNLDKFGVSAGNDVTWVLHELGLRELAPAIARYAKRTNHEQAAWVLRGWGETP